MTGSDAGAAAGPGPGDGDPVRAFAPASVGNVACGFDVLGLALEGPGDVVEVDAGDVAGVVLREVTGDDGRLPVDAAGNAAGAAVGALLRRAGREEEPVAVSLHKGLPLAAGLGGSAASAVAAVVAADAFLGTGLPREELLACALEGERVAAGDAHPDNAAPSLYGGIVLVRSIAPVDAIPLPVPPELAVAVVHPHAEVATADARRALGGTVALRDAVAQWGNTAALVAGLYEGDLELVGRAAVDAVAEPRRAGLVPGFDAVKEAAIEAGALAASLSGAGPSVFALCRGEASAETVGAAMADAFRAAAGVESDILAGPVGRRGARVVSRGGGGPGDGGP